MPTTVFSRRLTADRKILMGLKTLNDYRPMKSSFSVEALTTLEQQMFNAHEARIRARMQYEAAYSQEIALVQQFHNDIIGARLSVRAQYGRDAQALQVVGLKRTSDRKRTRRSVSQEAQ